MGWIGLARQVEYALSIVGADKDEEGKYLIYGEPPCSFLGLGDELVIGENTNYFVQGQKCNLAGLLRGTSYGMAVKVF